MNKRSIVSLILLFLSTVACTRYVPVYPYGPGRPPGGHSGHSRGRSTSFFMASDRHENGQGNNLRALLDTAVKSSAVMPGVVILNGDHVGGGRTPHPDFTVSDIYQEIDSVLNTNTVDVILGYGSHDTGCTDGYEAFLSGPRRCDGYYVYGISFAQMSFATDSAAVAAIEAGRNADDSDEGHDGPPDGGGEPPSDGGQDGSPGPPPGGKGYSGLDTLDRRGLSAESATKNFSQWVGSLSDNAPIVVMSHMPLHAHRKDNLGASVWLKALKRAARRHDVIVLWAHNHTVEQGRPGEESSENAHIERSNYLLVPGDSIYVQSPVDSVSVGDVINFTYVNDGYLKLGYGSIVTFTDTRGDGRYDRMRIERFTVNPADSLIGTFGDTRWRNPYVTSLRY
ncbi:MAG: metallophosphoesterase [Bacteroidales bacterium]|nr:metallophosphoesterase [Bacteroidales bacterium]